MVLSLIFATGCEKDEPDPPGAITVNDSVEFSNQDGDNCGEIYWTRPDDIRVYENYGYKISICNVGKKTGLGDIKSIPNSGFINRVACEEGYGYVVKIENTKTQKIFYARVFVIESIVSTEGGIMGAKMKYQYPFNP